jgi:hypothetical protein
MPYGTSMPAGVALDLLEVLAIRENVIRVRLNVSPKFTMLGDPNDASDARRYTVVPVVGSTGRDAEPTRPVTVIAVEQVNDEGTILDLILDRPMSPEPGEYDVTLSGLVTAVGEIPMLDTTRRYTALFKGLVPLIPEFIINNRDIANPQTRSGIFDPLPVVENQELDALLGTFREDSQGDIAFDEGLAGYRKRVMRRLTTRKGKFAHLPNYGVSMMTSIKQLARAGIREFMAEEAESQIRQEPETVDVSVALVVEAAHPDITRYRIRARTNIGQLPDFNVPLSFSPTGL